MLSTCCILDHAGAHGTVTAPLWVGIFILPEVENSPGLEGAETQIRGH